MNPRGNSERAGRMVCQHEGQNLAVIMRVLGDTARSAAEIARELNMPVGRVASTLTTGVMMGAVRTEFKWDKKACSSKTLYALPRGGAS